MGQKRKGPNEIEFDENGNWTLETAKARLSKFYAQKQLDFQQALACNEIGHPPHRQYQVRSRRNPPNDSMGRLGS